MAYCVHCGVKLDESIERCPLCQTIVIDPNEFELKELKTKSSAPFPTTRAEVEESGKYDFAILLSVALSATAVTTFILNWLLFNDSWWSLYIVGICAVLWVYIFPPITFKKITIYSCLLMDYVSITLFLLLISTQVSEGGWFFPVAFPITTGVFVLIDIIIYLMKHVKVSFLSTALYIIISIGIQTAIIESSIDHYLYGSISLSWAAVVIAVAIIISLTFATILSNKKLRSRFRRRFHF
jgi:hypothetical protein